MAAQRPPHQESPATVTLAGVGLVLLALLGCVVTGLVWGSPFPPAGLSAGPARATVTAVATEDDPESLLGRKHLVVDYSFVLPDGDRVDAREALEGEDPARFRGHPVQVRYDPEEPTRSAIVGARPAWAGPRPFALLALVGLAGLVIAVLGRRYAIQRSEVDLV